MASTKSTFIPPLVSNSASEAQTKAAEQAREFLLEQRRSDLSAIMQSAIFRRVLWRILTEECGIYKKSFIEKDGSMSSFNEGKRFVGLRLMEDLKAVDHHSYLKMEQEAYEQESLERRSIAEFIKQQQAEQA